jgi:hypothetical protein
MKPRARRVTIAAAVLGAGVVAVLAVTQWSVFRDHLEAWRFQREGKLETIFPETALSAMRLDPPYLLTLTRVYNETDWSYNYHPQALFCFLASHSDFPVIYSSVEGGAFASKIKLSTQLEGLTPHAIKTILAENDWRVIEQLIPRRAYVVVAGPSAVGYGRQEAVSRFRGGGSSKTLERTRR